MRIDCLIIITSNSHFKCTFYKLGQIEHLNTSVADVVKVDAGPGGGCFDDFSSLFF